MSPYVVRKSSGVVRRPMAVRARRVRTTGSHESISATQTGTFIVSDSFVLPGEINAFSGTGDDLRVGPEGLLWATPPEVSSTIAAEIDWQGYGALAESFREHLRSAFVLSGATTAPDRIEDLNQSLVGRLTSILERLRELATSPPETAHLRHSGISGVEWLRTFLHVSRDRALELAGVSPATFYSWRERPSSTVRPKTIERLTRLVSSLRLAERSIGRDACVELVAAGSPSILDRLARSGSDFDEALSELMELARPRERRGRRRSFDRGDIMRQLGGVEEAAEQSPPSRPLDPEERIQSEEGET